MINFQKESERLPSTLILLSLLILLGSFLYMIAVPKPSVAGIAKGREQSKRRVQEDIDKADEQLEGLEKIIRPLLWKEKGEAITPLLLDQVSQHSKAQQIRLVAFRPQRQQAFDGVTEMPFSVYVNGSYGGVRGLLKWLDTASSKVVLRSAQISASDPKTSVVTAVISISAFYESVEPVTPAPSAKPVKPEAQNAKD